ncbi:cingulin-like [Thunnus albacares]|uniref:cingulin-like n=1 Tax=Thunnus albacares TaxID=8236 RepID=UPI001CF6D5E3|nr:cingulin-like [Thunnus albacares]
MRRAAAFLALLLCLYWTRAQGESGGVTENDVTQTEVQSEILGVKATSDQTNIIPDIWAELKELRDMVIQHSLELRNSKSNIEKLEQENTAIQARLTDSEIKNAVLEARMNASDNKVEQLERENTVLEARMTASENLVEELQRENIDLKARLNTGEKVVEELQRENTAIQARLTASEIKNAVLEARMSSNENEVEELQRENAERPKVAFSVGLTDAGHVGPFSTDITLQFSKIFTNIGEAYNPSTGVFTAPVRGTYYFRFNAWEVGDTKLVGIKLYHNDKQIALSYDRAVSHGYATGSNAFVLQLEKGDVIYLDLQTNCSVYDDSKNRTTFSGFLLFAM